MNFLEELKNELSKSIKENVMTFVKDDLPSIFEKAWDDAEINQTDYKDNIFKQFDTINKTLSCLDTNFTKNHSNNMLSLSLVDSLSKKIDLNMSSVQNNINEYNN